MNKLAKTLTPVMRQYLAAKESYPDALMFFRMGDFYELFFEDAVTAARLLDLKLTSRDRNDPDPTPMCGVPHHAAQMYIARLLEGGHNVALCEQMEDPSKAKGIVRRAVVRVFTPAIVLDGDALSPRSNQYVVAAIPPDGAGSVSWSLAAFDLTTGEMLVGESPDTAALAADVARLEARELLVPTEALEMARRLAILVPRMFVREAHPPDALAALDALASALGESATPAEGEALTVGMRVAAATVLAYARGTQPGHTIVVQRFVRLEPRDHLGLDETAQLHLEIFRTVRGERRGSLLHHVDSTVTAMGARRLRSWLAFPLTDVRRIRKRHEVVAALVAHSAVRDAVRAELDGVTDLERIAMRATLGVATPRDLGALRDGLARLPALREALAAMGTASHGLAPDPASDTLCAHLDAALVPQPAAAIGEGPVFREGFDVDLDGWVRLASGGRDEVAAIEQRERERTKIASLKVAYNRVFGYYVEVTKANLKLVPSDYKRKQTIAGGERFITEELYALEQRIVAADEQRREVEQRRFEQLVGDVAQAATLLARASSVLADLDALSAFATLAHRHDYCRPEMDDSTVIDLRDARHPVVESALEPGTFVPNDVLLDTRGERLLLVTGPNMAGKSTLMRQVALAVILAQAGSFVPAKSARIGVVDRVFTRVGAGDDLVRGESTFMVEMRETATILRGATTRSLVVFDEIGRGTSTFDGLAIAWSVAEYLHDVVKCRALFATHYHELVQLVATRSHAANVNVSARESGDEIVFLHKLAKGGASRSYGIAVARLAGMPEPVVARAKGLLRDLERGDGPGAPAKQLGLFAPKPAAEDHPVVAAVRAVDLDRMTPLDALNFIAQLRALAESTPAKS